MRHYVVMPLRFDKWIIVYCACGFRVIDHIDESKPGDIGPMAEHIKQWSGKN